MKWLLLMDLDGTVWDHKDVSATHPPFTRIGDFSIRDEQGEVITINKNAIDFLEWARSNDAIVSTLSWNHEEIAADAIRGLGLTGNFDFLAISPDPDKATLLENLLNKLNKDGVHIDSNRLVYVDDRDIHMKQMLEKFPEIIFIHMWKKTMNFEEAKENIRKKLNGIG